VVVFQRGMARVGGAEGGGKRFAIPSQVKTEFSEEKLDACHHIVAPFLLGGDKFFRT